MMTRDLRCPTCEVGAGQPCVVLATEKPARWFHKRRHQTPGFTGRDISNRQQCLTCRGWKYPAIHSCPGVPQAGRTAPEGLAS